MADNDKDMPVAADDDDNKQEKKEESKEDKAKDIKVKLRGDPKPDPGDGLPTYEPKIIEFKWSKDMKDKKSCDTLHMLYLLQLALNLVRLRTIERNKYFKSIGRSDRYINQLDNPQIMENFLKWHNEDKEKNKFDGELLDKSEKLHMINNIISEIGGVKKGPATKIYTKLKKDVVIETTSWLELPQPRLQLKSVTFTKLYAGEKVIGECTNDDIITLLTYYNPDPAAWAPEDEKEEKKENKDILRGVFQSVKWANNFKQRVKDGKKKNPKPSAIELDVIINGKEHALVPAEYEKFKDDDCSKEYIDAFEAKAKQKRRWEDLIVAFFKGEKRNWEYDGGKFDIPDPDGTKNNKVQEGTSPKELAAAGTLKEAARHKEGPYDGAEFEKCSVKQLCQECMDFLIPPDVKNDKKKPLNTKLRGGVNQILRELKKVYVQGILDAAAAQKK